mmetsp:Transcript_66563/g.184293  ORF Transcript_66563/g.184293 Transcript_66563/m.184293 type:complete len:318 (+) Transcript_66563:1445-2398(+)
MTSPSAGVFSRSHSPVRRRRCQATTSGPYSTKLPGSQRSSRFSRAVRCPAALRRPTALGRFSSSVKAFRSYSSARSGRMTSRSTSSSASSAPKAASDSSTKSKGKPSRTMSPTAMVTCCTVPPRSTLMSCSIFMASSTATFWPFRTVSPSATARLSTLPWIGASTPTVPGGPLAAAMRGAASAAAPAAGPATPIAPVACWATLKSARGSFEESTNAPAKPSSRAELPPPRNRLRGAQFPALLSNSSRCVSTNRVWALPSRKAGCCKRACSSGMLVVTPSTLNSLNALEVRAAAAERSCEGACTMTFARSESNDGFVS